MGSNDEQLPERWKARRPGFLTWALGLDKPNLTEHPQLLGVLPTLRFWNRIDTAKHQAPLVFLGVLLAWGMVSLTPVLSVWLTVPLAIVAGVLPLGLFERWLRREIVRRRGLPSPSPSPANESE